MLEPQVRKAGTQFCLSATPWPQSRSLGPADTQGQLSFLPLTLWLVTSAPVWAKVSYIQF